MEPAAGSANQPFFGKYRGIVTNVDDPRSQGRLRARVPEVLGDVETGWALPCAPYAGDGVGLFMVPPTGSGVWLEFEGGDPSRPIWSGCWWGEGQAPGEGNPDRKVVGTSAGHTVTLDDDAESVEITDAGGAKVTLSSSGIVLEKGGGKVEVSDGTIKINNGALEVS